MSDLPQVLSPDGEIVQVITADDFLRAGGIIDVRAADVVDLAGFTSNADHFAGVLKEAKGIASDELVRRMDRAGKWTRHEGGFTIKTSSPAAGTEKYDSEKLVDALDALVKADLIDREAADAAVTWVHPPRPEPYLRQSAAGIRALLKLGGAVAEAVLSAAVPADPPKRAAKVTRTSAGER